VKYILVLSALLASPAFSASDFDDTKALAQQGEAWAQYSLGVAYFTGDGVPENTIRSYVWMSMAKAQGNAIAAGNIKRLKPQMTKQQIAKAQALAAQCYESDYRDCSALISSAVLSSECYGLKALAEQSNVAAQYNHGVLSGRYVLDVDNSDYFVQIKLIIDMLSQDEDEKDRKDAELFKTIIEMEKSRDRYLNINTDGSFTWEGGDHYCEIREVGVVQGVKCFRDEEEAKELGNKERSGANINLTIRKTADGVILTDRKDAEGKNYIKEAT